MDLGADQAFLIDGGDVGAVIRAADWSATPLGDPATWPQSLKTTVSTCLSSRVPMLIWWGPELVLLYNDAARPLLGASKHPAALGQPGCLGWPELWDAIGPTLHGVLARGEATVVEDQCLPPERDGCAEERRVTLSCSPIRDESGGVGGVFCVVAEISERMLGARRDAELADATLLQRISAQLIHQDDIDALYQSILDAAIVIMRSDAASMQMLHPERGEGGELQLLGCRGFTSEAAAFWEWVGVDSGSACGEALRTGERVIVPDVELCDFMAGTADLATCRQTGIRAVQTTPLISRSGQVLGMLSTHWHKPHHPSERDLRLLDILVRQAADLVERKCATMALEAARRDAERARAAAEQANCAKSEFLAAMSHELRTPLNAIAGYLQLVEMGIHGPVTAAQRTALARARKSQQHLLSLINDVLNFAKLEAGRVEYHIEELCLSDVVSTIAPMIELQLAAKGVASEVRVSGDVMVRADRDKLQQILLNLLSNAAKFTDAGGRVTVETTVCEGAPPGVVCLAVADTGCGIPADKLETIFDPFVQVNRKLTGTAEGTGLGLAISRDLARGMGGDLRVRSVEGEGSTFTLLLYAPAPRSSPPPRASRTSRPDRPS